MKKLFTFVDDFLTSKSSLWRENKSAVIIGLVIIIIQAYVLIKIIDYGMLGDKFSYYLFHEIGFIVSMSFLMLDFILLIMFDSITQYKNEVEYFEEQIEKYLLAVYFMRNRKDSLEQYNSLFNPLDECLNFESRLNFEEAVKEIWKWKESEKLSQNDVKELIGDLIKCSDSAFNGRKKDIEFAIERAIRTSNVREAFGLLAEDDEEALAELLPKMSREEILEVRSGLVKLERQGIKDALEDRKMIEDILIDRETKSNETAKKILKEGKIESLEDLPSQDRKRVIEMIEKTGDKTAVKEIVQEREAQTKLKEEKKKL